MPIDPRSALPEDQPATVLLASALDSMRALGVAMPASVIRSHRFIAATALGELAKRLADPAMTTPDVDAAQRIASDWHAGRLERESERAANR